MSIYVAEFDAFLTEEEAKAYSELKAEEEELRKLEVKKKLVEKYKDKLPLVAKKYGVVR